MTYSIVAYFMFINVRTGVPVLVFDIKEDGPEYLICFMFVVWWDINPGCCV